MRLDLTSLTREDIAFWNARWSAGSTSNTQELHQDLQFCMQEQMDSKLDINTKRLGHWLCKNGWTPTRGLGNKRQWKKKQLCTLTKSEQVGDSNEATTHKIDQALARHKPWYIDLRNESLHFSKLEVLKTVIFIDREDTEPSVYWDFGRVIKTLNADNAKANMSVWWQTHRPWYEKIRIEFDLHPLSLLPCRRSLARKPGIINKADVTDETLMTAKALVAMLLHWSTNASMTRTRRAAAKAMLNDILNLALSAKYDSDEKTWHFIARNMMEETQKIQLTVTPASMKRKSEKTIVEPALCELIANKFTYLFFNRRKCPSVHACLVKHLNMLESGLNEAILKGKVGQWFSMDKDQWKTLEEQDQRATMRKIAAGSLSSQLERSTLTSSHETTRDSLKNTSHTRRSEDVSQIVSELAQEVKRKRKNDETSRKHQSKNKKAKASDLRGIM